MSVSKVITVSCDLKNCTSVLSWNETEVAAGRQAAPEEAQYLVLLTVNGIQKSFCCQLHAAEYFLPPGYETKQKQIIGFPGQPESEPEEVKNWKDEPLRSENSPINGQKEGV